MAIAFDAANGVGAGGSVSSLTFNSGSTVAGASIGIVMVWKNGNTVTGITWNGVAMTQAYSSSNIDYWYILLPPTGAKSIVVSFNASSNAYMAEALTYTGTGSGVPGDVSSSFSQVAAGAVNLGLTTITDKCWIVGMYSDVDSPTGSNSGCVVRGSLQSCAGGLNLQAYDSNGAITPPAATTFSIGAAGNGSHSYSGAAITLLPALTLNLTATQQSYSETTFSATLHSVRAMAAQVASYTFSGIAAFIQKVTNWVTMAKSNANWQNQSKS